MKTRRHQRLRFVAVAIMVTVGCASGTAWALTKGDEASRSSASVASKPTTDDTSLPSDSPRAQSGEVAGPEPEGLDSSSPAMDVIPVVAEKIRTLGMAHGLVGIRTDEAHRSIAVTWSGDVPDAVTDYVESRPFGVEVSVVSSGKYSRQQLDAARDRLTADMTYMRKLGIVHWSVPPDGSGLVLGTTHTERFSEDDMARLKQMAGIPDVTVNYGEMRARGYAVRVEE